MLVIVIIIHLEREREKKMKKKKKRKGRREREKLALRYSPNTAPAQLAPASIVGLRSTLFCLGCGAASACEVWASCFTIP